MNLLGVFGKYWAPGAVKSRLAADCGPQLASRIYQACLGTVVGRFHNAADQRWLVFWPPQRRREFAELAGPYWQLHPQAGGDLGDRMREFFERAFAGGASRVVLIGSDSPTLPRARIDEAFQALESRGVVLGPTDDGGYYLVGAARQTPRIFEGVAWSSAEVWQQTVARLRAAGQEFATLPRGYDVDVAADLVRLRTELRDAAFAGASWQALRSAVEAASDKTF